MATTRGGHVLRKGQASQRIKTILNEIIKDVDKQSDAIAKGMAEELRKRAMILSPRFTGTFKRGITIAQSHKGNYSVIFEADVSEQESAMTSSQKARISTTAQRELGGGIGGDNIVGRVGGGRKGLEVKGERVKSGDYAQAVIGRFNIKSKAFENLGKTKYSRAATKYKQVQQAIETAVVKEANKASDDARHEENLIKAQSGASALASKAQQIVAQRQKAQLGLRLSRVEPDVYKRYHQYRRYVERVNRGNK